MNNKISSNGNRYIEKTNSLPLSGGDTLSCVKCGNFKLRKMGRFVHKFGGRLFVCFICTPNEMKKS